MPIADLRSCVAVWLNWLIDVGPPGAALAPPIKDINVLCTYKSFVPFRRVLENVKDVTKANFTLEVKFKQDYVVWGKGQQYFVLHKILAQYFIFTISK